MGKFDASESLEDRALTLMMDQKKTAIEASRILKAEGVDATPDELRKMKTSSFDKKLAEESVERKADYLLDSVSRTIIEWEELYANFKKLLDQLDAEGKSFEQVVVLREMRNMLSTNLKKLGMIQTSLQKIRIDKMNVLSNTDVMIAIKQNQLYWFEKMKPELRKGTLVFNEPTPEVLNAFQKWSFKKRKAVATAGSN